MEKPSCSSVIAHCDANDRIYFAVRINVPKNVNKDPPLQSTPYYYMAGSASRQDEANPVF